MTMDTLPIPIAGLYRVMSALKNPMYEFQPPTQVLTGIQKCAMIRYH
jgi:hypothetical protein